MSIVFKATFDVSKTLSMFKKLPKNIQEEVGNAMSTIAKNKQRGLRYQLNRTSKRFDYKIWNGIKAKKISNNRSVVKMPREGFWLDELSSHGKRVVPLVYKNGKRRFGSAIVRWADHVGYKENFITVGRIDHQFITIGLKRGDANKQKVYDDIMRLAIKKSRR